MGWTKAVAGFIKAKAANYVGGMIQSHFAGAGNTKKLAAKLANKSPLDMDTSPVSHLSAQNDPFKYGLLYYPEETAQLGEGHYIIFDTVWNTQTMLSKQFQNYDGGAAKLGEMRKARERRLAGMRKQGIKGFGTNSTAAGTQTGLGKDINTHKFVGDSIVLYTPPEVKYEYKATYEQAETKNLAMLRDLGGEFKQTLNNLGAFMDGDFGNIGDLMGTLKDTGSVLGRQIMQGALEVTFPGASGFFTKLTGKALNPRLELAFQSVPFRTFSFNFDFAPKNMKEVESVNKIMQLFKFHMLPDVSNEKYMITPSEFQIMYYYRDKVNTYLPRISRCVCTDMSVDYAPENVFHTFKADAKGAMPVITKMTLSFTETEVMTKQTTSPEGGH